MTIIRRIGILENDSEKRAIHRLGKGLTDDFIIFHNFELTTGRGLPYEYDIAVLAPHALYHVEVKGYQGNIRGNVCSGSLIWLLSQTLPTSASRNPCASILTGAM